MSFLNNLQNRPDEEKKRFLVVVAVIAGSLVILGWIFFLPHRPKITEVEDMNLESLQGATEKTYKWFKNTSANSVDQGKERMTENLNSEDNINER